MSGLDVKIPGHTIGFDNQGEPIKIIEDLELKDIDKEFFLYLLTKKIEIENILYELPEKDFIEFINENFDIYSISVYINGTKINVLINNIIFNDSKNPKNVKVKNKNDEDNQTSIFLINKGTKYMVNINGNLYVEESSEDQIISESKLSINEIAELKGNIFLPNLVLFSDGQKHFYISVYDLSLLN